MEIAVFCFLAILRTDSMNFNSFLSDAIATILGGAVLTFLFFLAKEKLFPLPRVAGRWYFETQTLETAYRPFAGMVLAYSAIFCQRGPSVPGPSEKSNKNPPTGESTYFGTT